MVRVLVVEDEANIREMIALNLRLAGMEAVEPESAEAALPLLEKKPGGDAAGAGIAQQIVGPGRAAAADDHPGRGRSVGQSRENRLMVVPRFDGSYHQYKML